jgi:hypothetical protein
MFGLVLLVFVILVGWFQESVNNTLQLTKKKFI